MKPDLPSIIQHFNLPSEIHSFREYGQGHINDTYLLETAAERANFILQRINHNVFHKPEDVMHNFRIAWEHIRAGKENKGILVEPIATHDGNYLWGDYEQGFWRIQPFIANARSIEKVENAEDAFLAARAFGIFCRQLVDLDPGMLRDTIPDFHNTPLRYSTYLKTLQKDPAGRKTSCPAEIEAITAYDHLVTKFVDLRKTLPHRAAHNDTKVNNVLVDREDPEKFHVIDLDTMMKEYILFDFGDMIRTGVSPTEEDEPEADRVVIREDVFQAISRGYLGEVKDVLSQHEINHLYFGAQLITYEQAIRFLNDYLQGDPYYKIKYADHNLVRTRTQLKLLELLTRQEKKLKNIMTEVQPL